ncbi:MAG: undecaprenyldiphospho-muramoylpentapeptide beta-N-acetylglucosaminyltransferase [Chloroflexi bacterium]|nr:undecaprenyldiphospho-muramoylpentapeptide beta-N-acetylglucosaminyltransferase [Chloroflexota bacterium]
MRIVIAGGGSGGHIYPGLAVAEDLTARDPCCEIQWIGTQHGIEERVLSTQRFRSHFIRAGKLNRFLGRQFVVDLAKVPVGAFDALMLLRQIAPDRVLTCGGFVAVPVGLAAAMLGIPFLALQQDVRPNLANRILAPFATAIAVAFPDSMTAFRRLNVVVTGNPLRSDLDRGCGDRLRAQLSWSSQDPCVLVMGGSQGARAINEMVWQHLRQWLEACRVLHVVGGRWVERANEIKTSLPATLTRRYEPRAFLDRDYPDALSLADVVVTRAGAASLSEIAALGKCAVLIPLPPPRGRSPQESNAALFARHRAAIVLYQRQTSALELLSVVSALLASPARRRELAMAARRLGNPGATRNVSDLLTGLKSP